jgi:hypothetical protein
MEMTQTTPVKGKPCQSSLTAATMNANPALNIRNTVSMLVANLR